MNIMLVSVTERTREIGIRIAVGAKGNDILLQFLIESLVLSLIGGMMGIGVGVVGTVVLAAFTQWPTLFSMQAILLAFIFSGSVGVFLDSTRPVRPPCSTPSKLFATNNQGIAHSVKSSFGYSPLLAIPVGIRTHLEAKHNKLGPISIELTCGSVSV